MRLGQGFTAAAILFGGLHTWDLPAPPAALVWPFLDCDWVELPGSSAHEGPDRHARDLGRTESWRSEGSRVLAPIDGEALVSDTHAFYGEHVIVCGGDVCVLLAHLRVRLIERGTHVVAAQTLVGGVGSTGLAPWGVAHLHLAVYQDERPDGPRIASSPTIPFSLGGCPSWRPAQAAGRRAEPWPWRYVGSFAKGVDRFRRYGA